MCKGMTMQKPETLKRKINCDDVAWLRDVFNRLIQAVRVPNPSISRGWPTAKIAAILELMEILQLEFEDDLAAMNAIGMPEFKILLPQEGDSK